LPLIYIIEIWRPKLALVGKEKALTRVNLLGNYQIFSLSQGERGRLISAYQPAPLPFIPSEVEGLGEGEKNRAIN
jgi:hypothetical protein